MTIQSQPLDGGQQTMPDCYWQHWGLSMARTWPFYLVTEKIMTSAFGTNGALCRRFTSTSLRCSFGPHYNFVFSVVSTLL